MSKPRSLPTTTVECVNCGPLLDDMRHLYHSIGKINLQLPRGSPARAALRTLTDQMKEITTILTSDPNYLGGGPVIVSTAPGPTHE